MKKLKTIFFAMLSAVALLIPSCNSFGDDDYSSDSNGKAYLTLSVGSDARTALPNIPTSEFTSLVLKGTRANDNTTVSVSTISKSWVSYDEMVASDQKIAISAGTWDFALTAQVKQGSTVWATYTGAIKGKKITTGENALSFTLSLDQLKTDGGTSGKLKIEITLDSDATSKVKLITGKLLTSSGAAYSGSAGTATDLTKSGNKFTYEVDDLRGVYIAHFVMYEDEAKNVPVATWREVVNINSYGATSSKTISAADLDATYVIHYLERVNFADETVADSIVALGATTNANITSYSRRTAISLNAPVKEGKAFWRWVEAKPIMVDETATGKYTLLTAKKDANSTANDIETAVTEIERGEIGERYFCAEFIDAEAAKNIDHVSIAATNKAGDVVDSTAVGTVLTATAYTAADESDDTKFTGNVTWKWSVGDVAVDDSSAPEYLTDETKPTSLAANQIIVPTSYFEKTVKVEAIQDYIVTLDGEKITNVSKNKELYEAGDNSAVIKNTTAEIVAGTLSVNTGDNKVTLKNDTLTLIGDEFDNSKLSITGGTLIDAASGWTVATSTAATRVTLASVSGNDSSATALVAESSGVQDITVKFSVEGYEDLYETLPVHLYVKANAPVASDISFYHPIMVTKDKVRFKETEADSSHSHARAGTTENAVVARADCEKTLEYALSKTTGSDGTDTTTGAACTTNEFDVSSVTSKKIYVRVAGTDATDEETGAGYVAASDWLEVDITNVIGTLVRLEKAEFVLDTTNTTDEAKPAVGTTVSVKLTPQDTEGNVTVTNINTSAAGSVNGYTYEWKVLDGKTALTTGDAATFDISDASWLGKTLSLKVTPNYQSVTLDARTGFIDAGTYTAEYEDDEVTQPTALEIVKGKLDISEITLSYVNASGVAVKELPGAVPVKANIRQMSGTSVAASYVAKNHLATPVTVPVVFDFVPNVTVESTTYTVVRPALSTVAEDARTASPYTKVTAFDGSQAGITVTITASGYATETVDFMIPVDQSAVERLVSKDIAKIPTGHIQFNASDADISGGKLLYLPYGKEDGTDANWIPVYDSKNSKAKLFNKAGEYDSATATNGVINVSAYAVNDMFFKANETVTVRYKDDPTKTSFELKLTNEYIGTHGAVVSISIDEKAPGLTVVGNKVTAPSTSTENAGSYTWYLDNTEQTSENAGENYSNTNEFTISVDYTTEYDVEVRYKDSNDTWQNARAKVSVTKSAN